MERATHYRPRVSRETRLLVTTALLAVLALWMLARLRFPSAPTDQRALSQLLTPAGAGADFDALSTQVTRVRALVGPSLLPLLLATKEGDSGSTLRAAFRIGGDLAVVSLSDAAHVSASPDATVVALSEASRLAVVRLPIDPATSTAVPRVARPADVPAYLLVTSTFEAGVGLRPVFLPGLAESDAPLWSSRVWGIPAEPGLEPGAFVFTTTGDFAGMVTSHRGGLALVPGDTVLDEANRLISRPPGSAADYRIDVQELTLPLQRALAATRGVVVAWVDPAGPAAGSLLPGDVIGTADGQVVASVEHWRRHVAGALAGMPVALGVHRDGQAIPVEVVPVAAGADEPLDAPAGGRFGAVTRLARGEGTEVVSVEAGSLAWRSGLRAGDVITSAAGRAAPVPALVARLAGALDDSHPLVLAVRRGAERRLVVVER